QIKAMTVQVVAFLLIPENNYESLLKIYTFAI
ncbi:MAG: hypothetical protein ACJAZR_000608, partial [Sediminicola sp.]